MDQPPHPLLASDLRIERAMAHMLELREELLRYIDDHKGVWSLERNQEERLAFVPVADPPPFPPLPSILVGEVIYNLRAALDYLVYTLAVFNCRGKDVRGTQFPIDNDPELFEGRVAGKHPRTGKAVGQMLKGVNKTHVDIIRRVQPFNTGVVWTGTLRDLSNPDKHRTLTPFESKGNVDYGGPYEIPWNPGEAQRDVDIRYTVSIEVQLMDLGLPLLPTLKLLHDQTSALVDEFKLFFHPRISGE